MAQYWRIRLRAGDYGDFSRNAWDRDEVGVWYGGWTAEDFAAASARSSNSNDVATYLSETQAQRDLEWEVTSSYASTVLRFDRISEEDWVVLYLSDTQEIGLAKIQGPLCSDPNHPLNLNDGQLFKYREISNKKTFQISHLPDAYRLLPAQGRGNIHEFNMMWDHVDLLAKHQNADAIHDEIKARPFDELLDLLGASAWESFCFAYLIWEREFVPTGLSVGRTLATADIVGRNRNTGYRIVAQCKKDGNANPINPDFQILRSTLEPHDEAYYFAYGGCTDQYPGIQVVDRTTALKWAESPNGRRYESLLRGDDPIP